MKGQQILISGLVLVLVLLAALVGLTYAQDPGPQSGMLTSGTPVGTGFTYQGQLKVDGGPVNDECEMAFRLYDQGAGGSQVGPPLTHTVSITDGLFTINLDFGGVFTSTAHWLDIRVMCPGDAGFADLGRQELTAVPYAHYALSAGALQGNPVTTTAPAVGQVLEWNGAAWGPADDDDTTTFWSLGGNAGTDPVTHFLGTTDSQPLAIRTNGTEAVRITTSGDVGIGTPSPAARLEASSGTTDIGLVVRSSDNRSWLSLNDSNTTDINYVLVGAQGDNLMLQAGAAERVRITDDGNVGIGTTTPESSLQVVDYIQLDTLTAAPPATDCDEASERGRMKVDIVNNLLYICTNSGWISK